MAFAPPADWDAWLRLRGFEAGFGQTSAWAALHEAVNGARSFVLEVGGADGRLAGALLSLRPSGGRGLRDLARRLTLGSGTLECVEGPVLAGSDRPGHVGSLLEQVDELAARLRARSVIFFGGPPASSWPADNGVARAFARSGYRIVPRLTALVDLRLSQEELFARLRHAARQAVRKAGAARLRIEECRDFATYVRDFVGAYEESVTAEGRAIPARLREVDPWSLGAGEFYRYFVARALDGAILGTLGTYAFNGVATEIMSTLTPEGRRRRLPAQDLLHWEAFVAHRRGGDALFNLAGYSATPADRREEGIRRFKQKWGGLETEVPQFVKEMRARSRTARRTT